MPVEHVVYPNRVLREAGLLKVSETDDGELSIWPSSRAWALVDHQFSHVFVHDADPKTIEASRQPVHASSRASPKCCTGESLAKYGLNHARSGDVVLVSEPNSWQAYYWWHDDARAPRFARTVDIHRKPGYDPVELFFDRNTKGIPLDATLVRGSHGAPANDAAQRGVLLSSEAGIFQGPTVADVDVAGIVLRQFDVNNVSVNETAERSHLSSTDAVLSPNALTRTIRARHCHVRLPAPNRDQLADPAVPR